MANPSIWEAIGEALSQGSKTSMGLRLQNQERADRLKQLAIENQFRQHAQDMSDEDRQRLITKDAIEGADPNSPIDPGLLSLAQKFHLDTRLQQKPLGTSTDIPLQNPGIDAKDLPSVPSITVPNAPAPVTPNPTALTKPSVADASPLAGLQVDAQQAQDAQQNAQPPRQSATPEQELPVQPAQGQVGTPVKSVSVPTNAFGYFRRQTPEEQIQDAKARLITGATGANLTPDQQQRLGFAAAGIPVDSVLGQPPMNMHAVDIKPGQPEFKVAQDLAYGKMPFQTFRTMVAYGRDPSYKAALYAKAAELNPNFNPAAFEMGFKLAAEPKVQQQLASMDNVLSGVDSVIQASNEAARTSVPLANYFANKGGFAIGGKSYSNFRTAQLAFADELANALGVGNSTDMTRELGINMTDPNMSPEQFSDAINRVIVPFVQRKRDTLLGQMGRYGEADMNPAAAHRDNQPTPGEPPTVPANPAAAPPVAPPVQPNSGGRGAGPGPNIPPNTLTKRDVANRFQTKYGRQPSAPELTQAIAAFRANGISVQ